MTEHALFLEHRTKPGARDSVQKVWQKHMQPAIEANADHEIYVYSFASDPDRICAFQVYAAPRRPRPPENSGLSRVRKGGRAAA